jgi:hypothetical protein
MEWHDSTRRNKDIFRQQMAAIGINIVDYIALFLM